MAERIRGLSIDLDLDDTGITRSLGTIKRSFRDLNSSLKTNMNNFKYTEKSVDSYENAIEDLGTTIKGQQKNVSGLKAKMDELTQAGKSHTAEASKIRQEYNRQVDHLNMLERQLENTSQEFKEFTREQQIASSKWTIMGNQLDAMGDKLTSVGDRMRGVGQNLTMGLTVPLAGVGIGALKAAGEYEAAGSQFSQVFGKLEGQAQSSLDEIADKTGLLPNALRGSFTQMAAFAKTTGADTKEAMDLTSRATMAAADSAAFYDKSIEETTEALQSYLKGNYENDAALGISSTETTRNAAANKLYGKSFAELSEQQKQLTLLQMVEDGNKLSGALGQASRESDTLATQTSNVKTAFQDFLAELGKPILPKAVDILKSMSGAVKGVSTWFSGLSEGAKIATLGFGGFLAALGPVITGAGILAGSLGSIMKFVAPLGTAFAEAGGPLKFFVGKLSALKSLFLLMTGPVGLTVAAIVGLGIAFTVAYKKSETFRNVVNKALSGVKNLAMQAVGAIMDFAKGIGDQLRIFWQQNGTVIMQAIRNIGNVIKVVMNAIWAVMKFVWPAIKFLIVSTWENIKGIIKGALDIILGVIKVFAGLFTGNWKKMWEGIKQIFRGALTFVWNLVQLWLIGKVLKVAKLFIGSFKNTFKLGLDFIKNKFSTILNAIYNFTRNIFLRLRNFLKNTMYNLKKMFATVWLNIKKHTTGTVSNLWKSVKQIFTNLWNGTKAIMSKVRNSMSSIWKSIKNNTVNMASGLWKSVKKTFNNMKNGLKLIIDKIKEHISGMTSAVKKGVNKLLGAVNKVGKNLGLPKIPELHTGTTHTHKNIVKNGKIAQGTMAVVGDKGRGNGKGGFRNEIIEYPNGKRVLTPNRDTTTFLPKGSKVYSGKQTQQMLPKFDLGTGIKSGLSSAGSWLKNTALDTGVKIAKTTKDIMKGLGDVMDYASNPGKLFSKIMSLIGFDGFKNMKGGFIGDFARGIFGKMKKAIIDMFQNGFDSMMSAGGDGGFLDMSKLSYRYGNDPAYFAETGVRWHSGLDFNYINEPLHSTVGGRVQVPPFMAGGYGKWVKIISGALEVIYAHMSSISVKDGQMIKPGHKLGISGNTGFSTGPHLHYEMRKNGKAFDPLPWLKSNNGATNGNISKNVGANAKSWIPMIRKAAAQMKVSLTGNDVSAIVAQIHRESGGNQNIVQSSAVWDINTASGNPAQGLLQYIPQTFRAYAVKGHGNIRSGYDQLLAFFNNSNWRRDNPGGRSGWGPTGRRRFATGGLINNAGWYNIAEGGYPEWVIPTDPKRRSEAMSMIAMAANQIQGNKTIGNKRPSQLGAIGGNDEAMIQMLQAQQQQIALLTQLVTSNQEIAEKDYQPSIKKQDFIYQVEEAVNIINRKTGRHKQFKPATL
ncbi:phage tail tape measure protein [Macrococcoides goetzii]|uniref:lysostaphin n=1 Tax=Macrococcoides goetzii TaxID=1891097 RepID=A0A2G5NV89_9STAP|nr:peptidoglycan DD-metalloendopeptidase family protein [Macrococcus goetzii]RAI79296.1 phage tail tape measure protein [Macrococcus goetzii]